MNRLISLKDKQIIKVITGIRRSGKSTVLKEFYNYLTKNGVDKKTLYRKLKPLNSISDHYKKYLITLDYDTNNYNGIKQISAIDFLTRKINL